MLPPAAPFRDAAFSQLLQASHDLWPDLSATLRETTGIDNGFRRCGGLEIATCEDDADHAAAAWAAAGARVERLDSLEIAQLCDVPGGGLPATAGFLLPDHWQIRNPRHLQALERDCRRLGVELVADCPVHRVVDGPRGARVVAADGETACSHVVVAAGAWSDALLRPWLPPETITPVRGQMLLLRSDIPLRHIVQIEWRPTQRASAAALGGIRYLVPRGDGHILVGATVEATGFDARTTAAGQADLLDAAVRLLPPLANAELVAQWAGLRPQSTGGPFIGPLPGADRIVAATGHFRDGLCLSAMTAVRVGEVITASD